MFLSLWAAVTTFLVPRPLLLLLSLGMTAQLPMKSLFWLRTPLEPESLGAAEFDDGSDFLHTSSEPTFDRLLLGGQSLGGSRRLRHLLLWFHLLDGFRISLDGSGLLNLSLRLRRSLFGLGRRRRLLLSFLRRHFYIKIFFSIFLTEKVLNF